MVADRKPLPRQEEKKDRKPVVSVKEIKERTYYFAVFREDGNEDWRIKSEGMLLYRSEKYAQESIPPTAEEAHVLSVTLPL